MKKITLQVKGMVCTGCENRIKNAVSQIEGVTAVEANYQTGEVKVTAQDTVLQKQIEDTLADLEFEVVKEG